MLHPVHTQAYTVTTPDHTVNGNLAIYYSDIYFDYTVEYFNSNGDELVSDNFFATSKETSIEEAKKVIHLSLCTALRTLTRWV